MKALKFAVNKCIIGAGMELNAKYKRGVFRPLRKIKGLRKGEIVRIALKKKSIKDYSFVGMWKRRNDIRDGISYTKKVR